MVDAAAFASAAALAVDSVFTKPFPPSLTAQGAVATTMVGENAMVGDARSAVVMRHCCI